MSLVKRAGLILFSTLLFLNFFALKPVNAEFIPPSFPACLPADATALQAGLPGGVSTETGPGGSGNIKANYSEGQHAIVGVTGLQSGSDQVFSIGDNNFLQCFCPPQGSGIQTNWLAADQISQVDKNNLITQGWVLIPNGADWGLDPIPFLALNSNFSCNGRTGGGGGESSGGGTSTGGSGSGGSGSSSSGGTGGPANSNSTNPTGEVLGISTLAATSSQSLPLQITLAILLGSALIAYGTYLKKKASAKKAHKK